MKNLRWKPFFRGLFVILLLLCLGTSLVAWQLVDWLAGDASFNFPTVMMAALPSSAQAYLPSRASQPETRPTRAPELPQPSTPTPTMTPVVLRLSATYEARISEPMMPPPPTVRVSAVLTKTIVVTKTPDANSDVAQVSRRPTPTPPPIPTLSDAGVRPADRKPDYRWLAPYREQPFPAPAQAEPNRLVIPSINLDSKVIETRWRTVQQNGKPVNIWNVADYAVGFHFNSVLPGAVGNTVMAGHNNIRGQVFRNLNDTKIGDEIFVFVGNQAYRYAVTEKQLIKEAGATLEQKLQNVSFIGPTNDVRLTLVSCWPYTSNTHRVVVVAKPAPPKK